MKDDIASLRQSISQLSSLVQSYARLSIVKGISIVKDDEIINSTDDYISLPVSSEWSHHEMELRNNIYKLKRDISRKIMDNPILFKIVNNDSSSKNSKLDFKVSSKITSNKSSYASVLFQKISPPSNVEDEFSYEVLDRIESNISSYIPSWESASIFDECKNSIWFPPFQKGKLNKQYNINNNSESIKDRLNFEIERHHFLQNLSKTNAELEYFWCESSGMDSKELEIKTVETARFGQIKTQKEISMISYSSKSSHNFVEKPSSKWKLQ